MQRSDVSPFAFLVLAVASTFFGLHLLRSPVSWTRLGVLLGWSVMNRFLTPDQIRRWSPEAEMRAQLVATDAREYARRYKSEMWVGRAAGCVTLLLGLAALLALLDRLN